MGFFEIPAGALRRAQLADELPVEILPVFQELSELVLGLPDPAGLSVEQRLGAVQAAARLQTMLEAYQTQVAGVSDAQRDSRLFAAGTTGSMVAALTGNNRAVGSAIVGRARDLRSMPHVTDAYRAGEITGRHVHLLCRAAPRLRHFPVLEADLVAAAAVIEPVVLAQVLDVLITQDRREAPDEDLRGARAKRGLHLSDLGNGLYRVDGHLDQIAGARLRDALASFTDPPAPGDDRTPSQRLADALDDLVSAAQANTTVGGVRGDGAGRRRTAARRGRCLPGGRHAAGPGHVRPADLFGGGVGHPGRARPEGGWRATRPGVRGGAMTRRLWCVGGGLGVGGQGVGGWGGGGGAAGLGGWGGGGAFTEQVRSGAGRPRPGPGGGPVSGKGGAASGLGGPVVLTTRKGWARPGVVGLRSGGGGVRWRMRPGGMLGGQWGAVLGAGWGGALACCLRCGGGRGVVGPRRWIARGGGASLGRVGAGGGAGGAVARSANTHQVPRRHRAHRSARGTGTRGR